MKKQTKIFITLFLGVFLCGYAQKVKVKKGKILVDGVEVGIIEAVDKKNIIYTVKDLSGKELLKVDADVAEGSTRPFEYNWMTVSSKDYPQVNVVDYSMISMSLSHPKIIAEILTKTYGIFSAKGIDDEKIAEFFSIKRTSKYKEDATGSGGVVMDGIDEGFEGKIRVKGKDVLFDKKVIANMVQDDHKYAFIASNTKDKLYVEYLSTPLAGSDEILRWLVVSDNQDRQTEVKMEYLSGNIKNSRAIAELLAEKYNLLTVNGIENLDAFFNVERKSLTEEYRTIFNEAKEAYAKAEGLIKFRIEEEGIRERSSLSELEKGLIISKEGDKKLGTVESLKGVYPTDPKFNIKVWDKSKGLIAKVITFEGANKKEFTLVGYDNKKHKIILEGDTKFNKSGLYKSLSKILVDNGYGNAVEFGIVRAKEMAIEEFYAKTKEAGNLRYAPGYVLYNGKKGVKKIGGYITLYFKQIPIPEGVEDIEEGRIMNSNVDGKRLGTVFRFQEVKGIQTGTLYKARDNKGFCIYLEDGDEKCYVGKKLGTAKYGFVETAELKIEITNNE